MDRLCRIAGLVVACSSFAAAHGAGEQSDPKITMTMPASSAAVAILQLGTTAHVQLLTSPQTAKDVVSFQFNEVPLSEAMKRIADAIDGAWKREGRSYRLIRTAGQQNSEVRKEFDETVRSIRKSIQEKEIALQRMSAWSGIEADALASKVQTLIKSYNPNRVTAEWSLKGDEYSNETPIGRALTKVAASLDPIALASLKQQMKAVWSSNPTATQKPFPSEIAQIADDFLRAQADWASSIEKYQLKAPTVGNMTAYVGGLGLLRDKAAGKVRVILLSVTPQGPSHGFYCDLIAYDGAGKIIAQASTVLSNSGADDKAPPEVSVPIAEEKIKIDEDTLALVVDHNQNRGRGKKLASHWLDKLTRPELFDPLCLFLSPKLIQAANIKKVNMVAHLSDDMFSTDVYLGTKETTVEDFLRKDVGVAGTTEIKDGWLTVKPKRPSECRSRQADRVALGKYLRKLVSSRRLSIADLATFAIALPDTMDNSMPSNLSLFLRPETADNNDADMLRLYALLTPGQKSSMTSGGLPFGSLRMDERECVYHMIYQRQTQIVCDIPKGPHEQEEIDLFYNGLMHETTECLPNGVPPESLITLKVIKKEGVSFGDPNAEFDESWWSIWFAHDLARLKYMQDQPDKFPATKNRSSYNLSQFMFGRQVRMTFTFQFTPTISMVQTLDDTNLADFKRTTFDGLSDDFKKEFQEGYNYWAKVFANEKPGQVNGGGTSPPP